MERTYWVNQWFKPGWSQRNLLANGVWYNPYEAEDQLFQGTPQLLLDGIAAHEWTASNSHQNRLKYSVEDPQGCGNVAAYVERAVSYPADIADVATIAQNRGGEWLEYESGHNFVFGTIAAYGVWRMAGTNDPQRNFSTDGASSDSPPSHPCIRSTP